MRSMFACKASTSSNKAGVSIWAKVEGLDDGSLIMRGSASNHVLIPHCSARNATVRFQRNARPHPSPLPQKRENHLAVLGQQYRVWQAVHVEAGRSTNIKHRKLA